MTRPLRIAYVGNWKHSWCTEVHVARDAERLDGVTVQRIQEPALVQPDPAFVATMEIEANGADLLLYQRTWGIHPSAVDMFRRLEERGTQTASLHLDLYVGLEREHLVGNDPFWLTGTVFSADGDPHSAEVFHSLGVNHRWLPPAVVSDECVMIERPTQLLRHHPNKNGGVEPVLFVGSTNSYHPEWKWRWQLLSALRQRYHTAFGAYPKGTNPERVHGMTLNAMYQTADVVVGDSLSPPGHRNYWSDRVVETVGRGGFLLFPRVPGIEDFFSDGEHLRFYDVGDVDGIYELIDYYRANRAEARSIALKGQQHVRENHTYVHRVAEMLAVLGLRTMQGETV